MIRSQCIAESGSWWKPMQFTGELFPPPRDHGDVAAGHIWCLYQLNISVCPQHMTPLNRPKQRVRQTHPRCSTGGGNRWQPVEFSYRATGPGLFTTSPRLHSLALDGIAQQQQRLTGTGRAETLRTHQAHKIFYVPRIDDGSLTGDVVIGIGWPLRFEARAVLGWVS